MSDRVDEGRTHFVFVAGKMGWQGTVLGFLLLILLLLLLFACLFVCLSACCCLIRVETAFEKDTAKQGKSFTSNYFISVPPFPMLQQLKAVVSNQCF